ncbi:MAG: isoprenyl transferase [Kiritimatiellia bacterium]
MSEPSSSIPRHVAIIMDGNGRWAKQRGLPRIKGHEAGAESVRTAVRTCKKLGIKYLTLYAFSTENWVRPRAEIEGLMGLLRYFISKEEKEFHENKVRLRVMGRMQDLPEKVQTELNRMMELTAQYDEGQLILALSYSGRTELTDAVRQIAHRVRDGKLKPDQISDKTISESLYLPDVPDPDLMIRTSGEQRLSNFMLWQLSYSELYFAPIFWPDFRESHLIEAVEDFGRRHRRFGDVK